MTLKLKIPTQPTTNVADKDEENSSEYGGFDDDDRYDDDDDYDDDDGEYNDDDEENDDDDEVDESEDGEVEEDTVLMEGETEVPKVPGTSRMKAAKTPTFAFQAPSSGLGKLMLIPPLISEEEEPRGRDDQQQLDNAITKGVAQPSEEKMMAEEVDADTADEVSVTEEVPQEEEEGEDGNSTEDIEEGGAEERGVAAGEEFQTGQKGFVDEKNGTTVGMVADKTVNVTDSEDGLVYDLDLDPDSANMEPREEDIEKSQDNHELEEGSDWVNLDEEKEKESEDQEEKDEVGEGPMREPDESATDIAAKGEEFEQVTLGQHSFGVAQVEEEKMQEPVDAESVWGEEEDELQKVAIEGGDVINENEDEGSLEERKGSLDLLEEDDTDGLGQAIKEESYQKEDAGKENVEGAPLEEDTLQDEIEKEISLTQLGSPAARGEAAEIDWDAGAKSNSLDEGILSSKGELETPPEVKHSEGPDALEPNSLLGQEDITPSSGFHLLRPRKGGSSTPSSSFGAGAALLVAFSVCFCLCRYWRHRRNKNKAPHRGKYAALRGSDDFFNGTFSDDISFRGRDSDEEMSVGSYESDEEGGGGLKLEMGGIHELDANGGLTLDECNG